MVVQTTDVIELNPQELMCGLIEVIRETNEKVGYYEMKEIAADHLDSEISKTIKKELMQQRKKLTQVEVCALAGKIYNQIMMRSTIQALSVLSEYYADAKKMCIQDLLKEEHKPRRLSRFVKATGIEKPLNTATHAIVSGTHPGAEAARKILAKFNIRIDDPDNGVFLPRNYKCTPHPEMPDASNHAEIHTREYYLNVTTILNKVTSNLECRIALRLIAKKLQAGTLEYKT